MKKELTEDNRKALCDLFAKCGEGDLLDFIHAIKRMANRYGWTQEKVVWIMENMPDDPERKIG